MDDDPQTTVKPWEGNRLGDPRQLIYEADKFAAMARRLRADANVCRDMAEENDRCATHYETVARDYCKWANIEIQHLAALDGNGG